MKVVNVTVRGGNTTEGATGVSFSVMPYEVVVQIPGSREPILSVPVVDNPLLNRQAYSFAVEGYEVELEIHELIEECGVDATVEEEFADSGNEPEEWTQEQENQEFAGCDGQSDEPAQEQENQEVLAEALGEPEESILENSNTALDVLLETSSESDVETETLNEQTEAISFLTETNPAIPEEEEDTAFFQRAERGHESPVDETESVVSVDGEQKSAEELKQLLEQTQALLQKYDMNNVEH